MATHFSILAWRIPWTEEPGRLQFIGFHRVRHDWSDSMHACMCRAINTVQKDTLSPGSLVWISAVFTFQPFSFMYIQAFNLTGYSLVQSLSHVQLCDPMDCSMRGFPVHHQLPELAQTYVYWVSDAIQRTHPLLFPPPSFSLAQLQGLFQGVSSSYQVANVFEFQLQQQSFQWTVRTDFLEDWLLWFPCSPRDSQESSSTPQFKSINSSLLSFLYSPTLTSIHDHWKNHSLD